MTGLPVLPSMGSCARVGGTLLAAAPHNPWDEDCAIPAMGGAEWDGRAGVIVLVQRHVIESGKMMVCLRIISWSRASGGWFKVASPVFCGRSQYCGLTQYLSHSQLHHPI